MKDNIKQECNVKGHVLVELFDAKTGELIQREEGDNFITELGKDAFSRAQQMQLYYGGNAGLAFSKFNWTATANELSNISMTKFRYLHLTDDSAVEDETNDKRSSGNRLAYADLMTAYAGVDTSIGTINESESHPSENVVKFVCDFGTDKANGTFQSIYLTDSTTSPTTAVGYLKLTNIGLFRHYILGDYTAMAQDANYYYVFGSAGSSTSLYKIDKTTFAVTALASTTAGSITVAHEFGGYIYYGNKSVTTGNKWWRYNIVGNSHAEISSADASIWYAMGAWDDGVNVFLYSAATSSTTAKVFRIQVSDFTVLDSKTPPSPFQIGGSDKTVANWNSAIYFFNSSGVVGNCVTYVYSTNTVTNDTVAQPILRLYYNLLRSHYNGYLYFLWPEYRKSTLVQRTVTNYDVASVQAGHTILTRKLLISPITKNNTQALKITYTFTFT